MPRANRYTIPGVAYHVTHRCHDRSFLLRFAKDRAIYRKMLRERLRTFPVSLLGYCITSNHVLCGAPHNHELHITRTHAFGQFGWQKRALAFHAVTGR